MRLSPQVLRGLLDASPAAIGCFDRTLRAVYANTAFTTTTGVQAGRRIEDAALAREVRALIAAPGAPRRVRLGGPQRIPISGTLFELEGGLIGMVLDAGAYEAMAALAEEQAALRRVATLVASGADQIEVVQAVAAEAGRLLHARSAATIRYDGDYAVTVGRWATEDDPGGFVVGTAVPLRDSDSLTALIARTGKPARIDNYEGIRGEAARMMRELGFRADGGRTWGLVLVASTSSLITDAEHRLAGFAELVGLALESAEARAELNASRMRILEAGLIERRRLERNLHDGAQQRLVALAVQLRLLEKKLGDNDVALRMLRAASEELEHALDDLRELARGLHPAVLAERGLAPALEALATRAPLPVTIEGVPEQRLSEPLEAAIYFVVAESLTNAVKHAGATELRVTMDGDEDELRVEIADDGCGGADPDAGEGTGLRGLADRVEALGGSFTLDSPPGEGTVIRAVLPLTTKVA
jgi:signal transduction histidine kinase